MTTTDTPTRNHHHSTAGGLQTWWGAALTVTPEAWDVAHAIVDARRDGLDDDAAALRRDLADELHARAPQADVLLTDCLPAADELIARATADATGHDAPSELDTLVAASVTAVQALDAAERTMRNLLALPNRHPDRIAAIEAWHAARVREWATADALTLAEAAYA